MKKTILILVLFFVSGLNAQTIMHIMEDGVKKYEILVTNNTVIYFLDHLEMVTVNGGTFSMGSVAGPGNEQPVHSVTLSTFKIAKYEVTQNLWKTVMGTNPSSSTGDENRPVEQVSWADVQSFITTLNGMTGKTYRLPTEAEWEYAARGGNQSQGYTYAGSNDINAVAWYDVNSGGTTHPVGTKAANELGIYDMSGNVWEWCSDWYSETYYSVSPNTNPPGPGSGTYRVLRGGSRYTVNYVSRSAFRFSYSPNANGIDIGFRLAEDLQ
ncbi:MAG: formylglycine-generating enzyme family protein [bacterium]